MQNLPKKERAKRRQKTPTGLYTNGHNSLAHTQHHSGTENCMM
jgi:hypothetical protein